MDFQDGDWVSWLYMTKWFFLAFQICFVFLVLLFSKLADVKRQLASEKFLIVTAHPDDEVMFFFPFISSFVKTNEVGLLCLSTGDADGLGRVRSIELEKASKFLGLSRHSIADDPLLRDGMRTQWDISRIRTLVKEELTKHNYTSIVTFDQHGVSSHPNHIAIHSAIKGLDAEVNKFQLISTNIVRKYIGILDLPFSVLNPIPVLNFSPVATWSAMSVHWSQFVWYRRLFVVFSRYGYLNTLERLS
mmetsp:Transcript_3507/g.7278  ORF Transcript_3507/g.7278 Transcript_3507/m.7278 type:complete len:246 (-) Transcript_3507:853-1590(-)